MNINYESLIRQCILIFTKSEMRKLSLDFSLEAHSIGILFLIVIVFLETDVNKTKWVTLFPAR